MLESVHILCEVHDLATLLIAVFNLHLIKVQEVNQTQLSHLVEKHYRKLHKQPFKYSMFVDFLPFLTDFLFFSDFILAPQ